MAYRKLPKAPDTSGMQNPCSEIPLDPPVPKISLSDRLHKLIDVVFKAPSLTREERIAVMKKEYDVFRLLLPKIRPNRDRAKWEYVVDAFSIFAWCYLGFKYPLTVCLILATVYIGTMLVIMLTHVVYISDHYMWFKRIQNKIPLISFGLYAIVYIGIITGVFKGLHMYFSI